MARLESSGTITGYQAQVDAPKLGRKYDYNYFSKGILEKGRTEFSRDSNVKYSKDRSYKIENKVSNDAMFYREVTVRKNTPYRVTCMVRTENVVGNENDTMAGAQICLNETDEHSNVIQGNTNWTKIEFLFNSKNNEKVEIEFRLGGGVFLIDNVNVTIEGKKQNYSDDNNGKSIVENNMQRLQNSIADMSNNQMSITYDIIEIKEPLTSLSYDEDNGYYIGEKDVYKLINKYVQQKSLTIYLYVQTFR